MRAADNARTGGLMSARPAAISQPPSASRHPADPGGLAAVGKALVTSLVRFTPLFARRRPLALWPPVHPFPRRGIVVAASLQCAVIHL
jgi:hypothetical protein